MGRKKYFGLIAFMAIAVCFGHFARAQEVGVTLPSVPGSVTGTVVPPSQISVSWSASTESSGTIEGYYVYRNGGEITATADTSFLDSGLNPGVYVYTVSAYDAAGNVSAASPVISVSLIADTTPPTAPTSVTVSGTTSTDSAYAQVPLTISWNASTDNVGVAGYFVYRNQVKITTSTTAFTGTSIVDTVTPGTYTYAVVAYDAAQNFSNPSAPAIVTVAVDDAPPSRPTDVSAQQVSASGVNLSWATSTDSIGVAGYQIYRDGIQIATAGGPPYSDSGLSTQSTYNYTVAAYDPAGNISEVSPSVQVTIQPLSGLGTPDIYSANQTNTSTVKILWTSSSDVLPITAYTVYRNGTQIASVTSTNYLDAGLTSGAYAYTVSATDVSGATSATSAAVSAIIVVYEAPSTPTSTTSSTVPISPVVSSQTSPVLPAAGTSANNSTLFSQALYLGLRSGQVNALQELLSKRGYLSSIDVTGFFGNLTLRALQKLQCAQGIVCTGGAGWGTVGPKTRSALNDIEDATSSSSATSTSAATVELQQLEAELASLEKEL